MNKRRAFVADLANTASDSDQGPQDLSSDPTMTVNWMSPPANIPSRNRYAIRATSVVRTRLKSFFTRLYAAIDKAQRKRAAQLLQRYEHLIDRDQKSDSQK